MTMAATDSSYTERCCSESPAKRQKQPNARTPLSFVTWNCNGLLVRCKNDPHQISKLVRETHSPDVILLQEVRCKAKSGKLRSEMCAQDELIVRSVLDGALQEYTPVWSLNDPERYSGTCTLVHRRLDHSDKTNMSFSTDGATQLLLQTYNLTREETGVAASTSSISNRKQASVKDFFACTKKPPPHKQHHPQGRFQYLQFPNLDLIHTYVPNHGTKQDSFRRREEWDEAMLEFLTNRQRILHKAGVTNRPLLWAGDMNVARDHRDGTHWSTQEDGSIYEWWTDESKCFIKKPIDPTRQACHMGMPSFTPSERERFDCMLSQGKLTDVWRMLHPSGKLADSRLLSQWERPEWTWRGHMGKGGVATRYQGKGQRLDYFLTSNISMERVESCDILGYGENRRGLFCGSDHCAVKLQLREAGVGPKDARVELAV